MIGIETQVRQAIREAVNRSSRKPFAWGGLRGYEQLEAIAQGLASIRATHPQHRYLYLLRTRVEGVLAKNRTVAEDLKKTYQILLQVSHCFHYPPPAPGGQPVSSDQVAQAILALMQETQATGKIQRAQLALLGALKKRWKLYGPELLHCYTIPGLPQDNLQLESLFGRLRRHQRRIRGRPATRELLDFGQAQILFTASSLPELLKQVQRVPQDIYRVYRNRLAAAEFPRQFLRRLHRDPLATISALVSSHSFYTQNLIGYEAPVLFRKQALHTN